MTPTRRKIHRTSVAICLLAGLAGCASLPPPTNELAAVDASISAAATPDGQRYAPDELAAARNELASAQAAMAKQDYERARQLAALAQTDADLARAKGRARAAQAAVAVKTQDNETLRHRLLDQEPLQ
jgi:multidrug resistance efflux pump